MVHCAKSRKNGKHTAEDIKNALKKNQNENKERIKKFSHFVHYNETLLP